MKITKIIVLLYLSIWSYSSFSQNILGNIATTGTLKVSIWNTCRLGVDRYTSGAWQNQWFFGDSKGYKLYADGVRYKHASGYFSLGTAWNSVVNTPIDANNQYQTCTKTGVLTVKQTIYYPANSSNVVYTWDITNNSGATINDLRFFSGGDTYLAGGDFGEGYWDAATNTIGVTKIVGGTLVNLFLTATGTEVPFGHASEYYADVRTDVNANALSNTVTAASHDNGIALEWRKASLAPGATWTITAQEYFDSKLVTNLTVTAPVGQTICQGETKDMTYTVQNTSGATVNSITLGQVMNVAGWTGTITNPVGAFSIAAGATQNVTVSVFCPLASVIGSVCQGVLTATYAGLPANATGFFTVTAANTAGAASSSPTLCISTALTAITHATTGATGISNSGVSGADGLPAGVSATWAGNVITISGTPSAAGTFNYSIPLTGGCGTANATGTIIVTALNTAGAASSSPTLCSSTALTAITHATTSATGISNSGVTGANGLPAGVSAAWAGNVITISGTPSAAGTFNYSIPLTGGCGTVSASGTITVNPVLVPSVSIVSSDADNTICAGTSVTFTATPTNGGAAPIYQWYLNGAPVGTGGTTYTTTGLVNADVVTCILTSNAVCASPLTGTSSGITTTVNPLSTLALTSASTTSNQQVCINAPINTILYSIGGSATGATITGLPAGVSSAFAGGLIAITGTPTSAGSYTYTVATTGGCAPAAALSGVINVIAMPVVASITGTTNICVGTSSLLNDATATGVWTSSSASASVGSTGLVLGLSAGSSIINYMVTINGCSTTVSTTVNVLTFPIVAPISGPTSVCEASMIDLNDASLSGMWSSSSTGTATINSAGEVVGISAGTATMTYTISNGVCSTSSSYVITVNPLPFVAAITGASEVCEGDSILLSDSTPAGVWTTDSPLIASVNPLTGMVTGESAGVAIISYVITDLSCSANVSASITVNPLPVVAPIIAPADVCQGDSILLSDLTPGGVWTSESLLIATINSSGMLTALSAGTSVIDYEVTLLGCSSQQTSTVTVYGTPAAPLNSGDSTYCSTAILSDLTAISGLGGTLTWYSDSTLLTVLGEGSSLAPTSANGTNTYYVTETVSGCEGLASAISISITICGIEIVTAFTPDGDLKNDKWILPDIDKSFPKNVVYIYNRWGTLIFQSEQGQYEMKPWDGTHNGKALPVDSYFYMIEYNDDYTTGSKGNVSIIIVQ